MGDFKDESNLWYKSPLSQRRDRRILPPAQPDSGGKEVAQHMEAGVGFSKIAERPRYGMGKAD